MSRHNRHTDLYRALMACVVAIVATMATYGQDGPSMKVTAHADTATLVMGDRTVVNVEVLKNGHAGVLVDMPKADTDYHGLELVDQSCDSTDLGNDRWQLNYKLTFQCFEPNDLLTLPPFRYAQDGDTVASDILTFKIYPVDLSPELGNPEQPDSLTIHPDVKVQSIESRWYDFIPDWWYWVVIGLVVAGVGVTMLILFRRHGRDIKTIFVPRRVLTPYEAAMLQLKALRDKRLIENGMAKQFYTEVTDIWRNYLAARFGINAMEMTSRQILRHLRDNVETHLTADQMEQMLQLSDFVKFAALAPTRDEMEQAYRTIYDFVESTRPLPQPDEESEDTKTKKTKPAQ